MTGVQQVTVGRDEDGMRLDRWFKAHFPELAHGRLEKLLRKGQVRVDGGRVKSNLRLEAGQIVRVPPLGDLAAPPVRRAPKMIDPHAIAELQDRILYTDDNLIALDKPAGLAVQGGSGTSLHVDAMLDHLRFGASERPRLVHRLDKDTSGVLVLARSAAAARWLTAAFRDRAARKVYWAVVVGVPAPKSGIIHAPLAKLPGKGGEKMVIDENRGLSAKTGYRVLDQAGQRAAWLLLEPRTGRTHQLRVHCMALETPIVGDGKYGGAQAFALGENVAKRMHLHARALQLPRPKGGPLTLVAPLPDTLRATWDFLGFDRALEGEDPFLDDAPD
ncbi:MAG: RluA family pseudouridine synthase [Magnetospiraceae bacterium]